VLEADFGMIVTEEEEEAQQIGYMRGEVWQIADIPLRVWLPVIQSRDHLYRHTNTQQYVGSSASAK